MNYAMRLVLILVLMIGALRSPALALGTSDSSSTHFLEFPQALSVAGAAQTEAFAWLIAQGGETAVMFARAPDFAPVQLFAKSDADGQPISSVAISADARFVVFQTGAPEWGENAYNPWSLIARPELTLWVTRTDTPGKPRKLGPGTSPSFAPSAARLVYKHGRDLYAADFETDTAESHVLVQGGAKLAAGEWSADGQALAFVDDRGSYSFIGLYRVGADRIDWIVTGADRVRTPKWSPDGSRIAYLRFAGREHSKRYDLGASEAFDVEVVDVTHRTSEVVWHAPGPATFPYFTQRSALRWADNQRIVFYSEHDGWGRLYAIDWRERKSVALTPPGCEVAGSEIVDPTRVLVVHNCPNLETRHLSLVDVRNGQTRDINGADLVITEPVRAAGRFVAFTGGDAAAAPLLRILDVQKRTLTRVEHPGDYHYQPSFTAPAPQAVTFSASDGTLVHANFFPSAKPGKRPAVVWFHGGPYAQNFPAFHFTRELAMLYAMNRQLTEQGFDVLSVNYRGSQGYGLRFRQDDARAWRGASEVMDSEAAARWLQRQPGVDRDRIGVWGGSYGGYMTAQSLARHSDLYRAGVAFYGLFDWSFASDNGGRWDPSRDFGVGPNDREIAFHSSPVGALDRWKSPVLLFAGDNDIYVDIAQTVDLTQRLRAHHVEVETTIVPDESHGFVLQSNWVRLWSEGSQFLARHLN